MIFWIIVGIAVGYFFKPQLDNLVGKALKTIKDNKKNKFGDDDY
ncbi:MAG: hypothetical protein U9N32_01735 [Spirochaetota bacterium]|nr:hypothetical protein [Spirochaetota bacterium]